MPAGVWSAATVPDCPGSDMTDGESLRDLVRESYNRLGNRYSLWAQRVRNSERDQYTRYICKALPTGSRVLDLGCGDGSLLTAQLTRQFQVTGVDISHVQLALAKENAQTAQLICADISRLSLPPESFEGVTAFYCLTHLPRADLGGVLNRVGSWLRPGGLLVASFGSSEVEAGIEPDWLGVPMFFSGHAPERNRQLVMDSGLAIEHDGLGTEEEFDTSVTFHWIVGRKPPG